MKAINQSRKNLYIGLFVVILLAVMTWFMYVRNSSGAFSLSGGYATSTTKAALSSGKGSSSEHIANCKWLLAIILGDISPLPEFSDKDDALAYFNKYCRDVYPKYQVKAGTN